LPGGTIASHGPTPPDRRPDLRPRRNLGQRPECIGAPRILEQFIATARALPGVEFGRLDSYVERWQAGPG
jgi:hypothetical protein